MLMRRPGVLAAATIATVLLAACGTTEEAVDPAGDGATSGEAITVQDFEGEDVVLESGTATRVVALEWEQAEIYTDLGVDLVGVADVDGYTSWVGNSVPLIGEPTDVGTRGEPSVETIAELEPDLIVGSARSIPEAVDRQMSDIAPVLLLGTSDMTADGDPLAKMESVISTFSKTVAKEAEGEELYAGLLENLDGNAQRVADAGMEGTPATFTAVYEDAGSLVFRLEGEGAATRAVFDRLGLEAAYAGEVEDGGLAYSDVEGLTEFPDDAWLFHWANSDAEDPIETQLAGTAVWDSLPMVEQNHVRGVADGVWLYGGPTSLGLFADEVTEVLAGS